MDRVILHCDANSYYASVECLYTPEIREKPVAVSGDPEARHGIILTKNTLAKKYGVKTGEAIWQAKQKCPELICVPPDFPLYVRFSGKMRKIYEQYSSRVESFGLDENWIDLTQSGLTFSDGARIAEEIRIRIREELGITVSIGVADNKILAKLGSDMKKPDAVTLLPPDSFREKIWNLPVQDLLYVGPSTTRKLARLGVTTIGALARCDDGVLLGLLGKNGLMLKAFANGQDQSPVRPIDHRSCVKSVGNSTTPPHDLTHIDDARCIYYLLAESVAARLREGGFRARCISISARTTSLITRSHQVMLARATNLTDEIAQAALSLFCERFSGGFPYRSVGLTCSMLSPDDEPVQLDFMGDETRRIHKEQLERSIDDLRRRYGHQVIQRGVVLRDRGYAQINPVEEHTVHPVNMFTG
ncbi:MAG: DNA polymerase IV [Clostridia bacterium]|nr:DNA polymerase IV [Clostridia bacterium]